MPDVKNVQTRDLSTWAGRIGAAWNLLLGRDFGPGVPLRPRTDVDSKEQTEGPRQWQYPFGINMQFLPRRESIQLTPFEQLRNLATLYDVAAMCIAVRIEELQGMNWSVVTKDKKQQAARQRECDEVFAWWSKPDKVNTFDAWLGMALYEMFSIDALTLYRRPNQAGGLYGLDVVDGSTIKPLLDDRGRTMAYQQILYGYPFSEYHRPDVTEDWPVFGRHELIYQPRWPRTFTPYGFPPTEWIIIRVNQAIRKQAFDLAYFTDGNIPDMIATMPNDATGPRYDPKQVADFEEWFNAVMAGNDAERRKVRFIPWAANFTPLKEFVYQTELDYWMLRITCAAYGTVPSELGFTDTVNKASSEMQEAVNERRGLRPLTNWLKRVIFDPVIQQDLEPVRLNVAVSRPGFPTATAVSPLASLEMQWNFGEQDDRLSTAQVDAIYLDRGVVSEDDVRTLRFGDQLDGAAPGRPASGLEVGASPLPFRQSRWDDYETDDGE